MLEQKLHDVFLMRHTAKWTADGLVPTHWVVVEDANGHFVRSKVVEGYESAQSLAREWRQEVGISK